MKKILWACVLACLALPVAAADIDSADLESFTDGVMATAMAEEHVAGAVVGVVVDGKIVLLKGYGYSDVESKAPVDPNRTLFRPGSVTKLFTWVSLMQMQSAGKVDLDTDVNRYLTGIKIPATYPQPITLANLMTHTAGFEDRILALFGRDAASMRPLKTLLAEQMPARVRPPGLEAAYSNHGAALAGLVVQQVSDQPWADYVQQHVLMPLGMSHSTVRQPLPTTLAADMSKGYVWQNGEFKEKPFEFVPLSPAGGASVTGADMMRFIQALLDSGANDDGRILSPAANADMQKVLFRAVPETNGITHGFYETSSNGQLIIGHGGDTLWFHSELMLMPHANTGWFISTNSATGPKVVGAFRRAFLDRYFGPPRMPQTNFPRTDLAKLVGTYGSLRHSYTHFTKLAALFSTVEVTRDAGGGLVLSGGGKVRHFREIAPLKFAEIYTGATVTFGLDKAGQGAYLYMDQAPVVAMERLSGSHAPALHFTILFFSLAVFGWILLVWTTRHFTRRWILPDAVARFRTAAWWLALSVIVMLLWLAIAIGGPEDLIYGITMSAQLALLMPYVVMTLALITALLYLPLISSKDVMRMGKFGYLLVVASGVGMAWFLDYWQLI